MTIELVTVENYDLWGKLVKSWATGKNYLEGAFPEGAPPRPSSDEKGLEMLKAQCNRAGVGIKIPAAITTLKIIDSNESTMLIKLPLGQLIKEKEQQYQSDSASYTLPDFYKKVFGNVSPTITDVLTFQAERIADYTIAQCS
jgi:hypothetical protein